ncbi:glycosyl hydrolase 53 family protein [Mucilaginibacter sp. PAMB04168]|uniref:glycoside hydrolase family 53 protein n=1 Tax=Mucilaginibacter sp. PAMB04168 TaxID=3138567 RepID=UPI0031F630FD
MKSLLKAKPAGKFRYITSALVLTATLLLINGCKKNETINTTSPDSDTRGTRTPLTINNNSSFLRGADVGFITEQEAKGRVFFNTTDQQDIFTILKERGINLIRLRVWVNPTSTNQYNSIADVVAKAVRAKNAGMKLLIDFHYSDTWADPTKQNIPAAWSGYSLAAMETAVSNHTTSCLNTLIANSVTPEYVQVGNETDYGMLWPMGQLPGNMAGYATLFKAGYAAVKAVNSSIKVIVHFSRGYDNSNCKSVLNGLIANGASFDVVGVSVYPTSTYATTMNNTKLNLQDLVATYNKEVLVAECGYFQNNPKTARLMVSTLLDDLSSLPNNKGLGVCYWEPQAYDHAAPNRSIFDATSKRPTLGMDGFSLVKNPGFEVDTVAATSPSGWITTGSNPDANYTETNPHTGLFTLTHWKSSAYNVATSQTITGLSNGLYTFQAWVKSPQTMVSNYLFAKDFGGTQINQNISINANWVKVTITNINVTNGQCTIGLNTAGNNAYCSMDDIEFYKQ